MNGDCEYELEGFDLDGTKWYICLIHDKLALSDNAPCAGYEEKHMSTIKRIFKAHESNPAITYKELEQSITEHINSQVLYIARVSTSYETIAIADSRAKARRLALTSAREWLRHGEVYYKSLKEVEAALGCNIEKMQINTACQEG